MTDISVDKWISEEFDRVMINKVGLLETLVEEDENEVEFDFAGEFMPEFEGKNNPEYFQLWYNDRVFERSDTLNLFEIHDLPRLSVDINQFVIKDITLPDGRSGRMLYSKFLPQVDSDLREKLGVTREEFAKNQKPIELSYALSKEELNYILWFVDVIFIITSLFAVIAVKIIVSTVVDRSLKPIDDFNQQLSRLSLNSEELEVFGGKLPLELIPIANGVNKFIQENHSLYKREQRITSDIAHELKTPIAELLSLSEVAIKFPYEKQLSDNLATDVHQISLRLKSIVNGILLLQKSGNNVSLAKFEIDLVELLENIIRQENRNKKDVIFKQDNHCRIIHTNKIALETILSNLINNALFYSIPDTPIRVGLAKNVDDRIIIKISNLCDEAVNEKDLNMFFEPLWQKDESRTSTLRYGLGLAIVKSYCKRLGVNISVAINEKQEITFTLII